MKVGYSNRDFWSFLDKDDDLLKEVLFFDQVLLGHGDLDLIEKLLSAFPTGQELFKSKMHHFEQLEKNGLIEFLDYKNLDVPVHLFKDEAFRDLRTSSISLYLKIHEIKDKAKAKGMEPIDHFSQFMELDRTAGEYESRYRSIELNAVNPNNEYIPILKNYRKTELSDLNQIQDEIKLEKADVVQIVLNNFPTIDPEIEIKKIVDLRANTDLRSRYFELRDFITGLSKQNLTPNEVQEKFEFLTNEYRLQLDALKLKYTASTISTICLTTAEVIENLATLKLSKALKALFDINKKELEMLEAERKLKGRETSYLYELNERLK